MSESSNVGILYHSQTLKLHYVHIAVRYTSYCLHSALVTPKPIALYFFILTKYILLF